MVRDPNILNLKLCLMRGRVIQYTRSSFLISLFQSQIALGGGAYSQTL